MKLKIYILSLILIFQSSFAVTDEVNIIQRKKFFQKSMSIITQVNQSILTDNHLLIKTEIQYLNQWFEVMPSYFPKGTRLSMVIVRWKW